MRKGRGGRARSAAAVCRLRQSAALPEAAEVVIKIAYRHPRIRKRLFQGDLFAAEGGGGLQKPIAVYFVRASETDALFLCGGDPFRLPCADVCPFVFRYEGQDLQHKVRDEPPDEGVAAAARIEQRHIQHQDVRADDVGDAVPFFHDHLIIAPEPVNGFDDEQVPVFQFFYEPQVIGAVKIFPAFFIAENTLPLNAEGFKRI